MKSNEVKSLCGQEFKIVKWGLDEEEVVAFATNLVKQRDSLLERQQHLNSLQMLAEKTVTEANELAEQIKQEAQNEVAKAIEEAEVKTREVTSEAQRHAKKTVKETNELAEQIKQEAQNEAAKAIEEAEEKAREVTGEAHNHAAETVTEANELVEQIKQVAQSQADKVVEEAEEKAHQVTSDAQRQADKTVQETNELAERIKQEAQNEEAKAIEEAHRVTGEAQKQADKTVQEANELTEQIKQEAQSQAAKVVEEAEEKAREIVNEVQRQAETASQEKATRILEQAGQEATAIIETAKRQVSTEIEDFIGRFHSRLQNLITEIGTVKEAMEQARVQAVEEDEPEILPLSVSVSEVSNISDNGEKGENESPETERALESEFTLMLTGKNQVMEEATAVDSADKSATLSPPQDNSSLFEGEIEIAMPPPVNMAQLIRFRRNLQDISHLKILRTTGSWKEGSVITALMDRPLPLISVLTEMPEVKKAEMWADREAADGDSPWGSSLEVGPESWQENRIVVTLKEEL